MQKFMLSIKILFGKSMHKQEDTIQMDLEEESTSMEWKI
jgi:hypothetical protein